MFDVDEREPGVPREPRRLDEPCHQPIEILIGQHPHARREAPVEMRMRVCDERLRGGLDGGPGIAAGVRELEAGEQVAVGVGAEAFAVRGDERLAQPRDPRLRARRHHQLVGIRAAVVLHGDRFAAPNQLRAADPEAFPSTARQIARLPIGRPVPSFHRQDAEPVADADPVELERTRERGRPRGVEDLVELERRSAGAETLPERVRRLERRDAWIRGTAHDAVSISSVAPP